VIHEHIVENMDGPGSVSRAWSVYKDNEWKATFTRRSDAERYQKWLELVEKYSSIDESIDLGASFEPTSSLDEVYNPSLRQEAELAGHYDRPGSPAPQITNDPSAEDLM